MKYIIYFMLLFQLSYALPNQEIIINNHIYTINMDLLLDMTAMIESRNGRDNYNGRVVKTYMQIEEETYKFYSNKVPEFKQYIEEKLGRKLIWDSDRDARYNAYIIYMGKMQTHSHWKDKLIKHFNGDVEWYIYKIYYNSIRGKSTYKKWQQRKFEYFIDKSKEVC